jgi:hypothetical protein
MVARSVRRTGAGQRLAIKLKLSKKSLALLAAALRNHRVAVTLTVAATDISGNKAKAVRAVTAVG